MKWEREDFIYNNKMDLLILSHLNKSIVNFARPV